MTHADAVPASRGRRRSRVVWSLLVAALAVCVIPGVADAKKKRDKIGILSYNLYLGSDLGPGTTAASNSRTDLFADEVGNVLKDVNANDFATRAKQIAKDIRKKKADLIGLQEAAFWKLQSPTDASGLNPAAQRATNPVADYIQMLLEELNRKAKTGKQCKKQDIKKSKCYRGYKVVVTAQEADLEFLGDFDNSPGPDGKTCDFSSGSCPNPYPTGFPGGVGNGSDAWLWGNDDDGVRIPRDPPAAQCADGIDNDGDGLTDYGPTVGTNETSGPSFGDATPATGIQGGAPPWGCDSRLDNSEGDQFPPNSGPRSAPQDTNMDHHVYTHPGNFTADNGTQQCPGFPAPSANCPTAAAYDALGNGLDAGGISDCEDNSADAGPSVGDNLGGTAPPWDAPNFDAASAPVCLFHGIDGDLSLTMRDAILKRKGAGVKTDNEQGRNFNNILRLPLFGGAASVNFTRGYTAVDAKVRGKKFRFVNTHLESENNGSIREDQASELIAPGGPATDRTTILVGDLNSDPLRDPVLLPNGDGGSNIAYARLATYGFRPLTERFATGGHGELLSDTSDGLGEGHIDHILTNDPGINGIGDGQLIDSFANGLWNSDHGGVFVRIKGKKRK